MIEPDDFDQILTPHKKIHSLDAWRVFRIVSEFVSGFETMTFLGPSVAIFGSAKKIPKNPKYYELATTISEKLVEKGFGIITGGAPGIMEHANKGAQKAKGKSCGLCINLPLEEEPNEYLDPRWTLNFRYFFVRKVMFVRYAKAFIVMPGGFGTLDEFFESLTLIQTKKINRFPVFLVGKDYWSGLLDWLKNTVLEHDNIKKEHLDLITVEDDPDKIAEAVYKHYHENKTEQNF